MNTRLQVKHPVTEAITGVDLVDWQLRVARDEPLPAAQKEVQIQGHAFEARLYAEDPTQKFLPAISTLTHLAFPDGLRADSGVEAGDTITPHYDPMIAKVIAHGADRTSALQALCDGLAATQVAGTVTNIGFLSALAADEDFSAGRVNTGLIARRIEVLTQAAVATPRDIAQAAVMLSGLADAGPHRGFSLHDPLRWPKRSRWWICCPDPACATLNVPVSSAPNGCRKWRAVGMCCVASPARLRCAMPHSPRICAGLKIRLPPTRMRWRCLPPPLRGFPRPISTRALRKAWTGIAR